MLHDTVALFAYRKQVSPLRADKCADPFFATSPKALWLKTSNWMYAMPKTHRRVVPDVKAGNVLAADYVLSHLGIKTFADWSPTTLKAQAYGDTPPLKMERLWH